MDEKIEPTDAMVEAGASSAWEEANPSILGWNSISERHKEGCRRDARAVLTAALSHPDAAGLFADEDDRPWEPLAPGDPLHAGDEVWRWWCGVSTRGIFDVQHPDSQVYTAERGHLGHRAIGTWCVRRRIPAPTPPAEEVELPGVPCALTDVRLREALAAGVALWTGREVVVSGFNGCASAHPAQDLAAFTLPDGTRARRDGERFVKAREGEK